VLVRGDIRGAVLEEPLRERNSDPIAEMSPVTNGTKLALVMLPWVVGAPGT
jgi:hypothetical protein